MFIIDKYVRLKNDQGRKNVCIWSLNSHIDRILTDLSTEIVDRKPVIFIEIEYCDTLHAEPATQL